MASIVTIRNMDKLVNRFNDMTFKFPKRMDEAAVEFLEVCQKNIRLALMNKGHIWRGTLFQSVKVVYRKNMKSHLNMHKTGIYLDTMKPHWVKLKRGRLIRQWAMQKGNLSIVRAAKRQASIYVKPSPFFDDAYAKSVLRLPQILKKHAKIGVEAK